MRETGIIDMVMKGSAWEDVLESIVHEEGLDPWDIDIAKLSDAFLARLEGWKDFNFRFPARLLIIAAILLNLKSMYLINTRKEEEQKDLPKGTLEIDISQIPSIDSPSVRITRRKVSFQDLIEALDLAFKTQERREGRKTRARRRIEEAVKFDSLDIEKEIGMLFDRINSVLEKMREGTLEFSSLVPEWERSKIISTFLPLLHLSNDGKISCEQQEAFKEIYIKLKAPKVV